ncbi:uncharacterized protein LOC135848130 isoform X2 [Planococcus citri]|uniref:uncharacterized protein LOC135848130 isoform X2 n=1 Tax=Planococcus citri TaxID=170843 RepID=UPI0031F99D38
MATSVSLLEQKIEEERKKFKRKTELQLEKDIFKIYSESIFGDILINVGNNSLKLHRCILQTRAPILYNIYCHNPNLIKVIPVQKLEIFFRDIYCAAEIREKEEEILKCIDLAFASDKESYLQEDSGVENSDYSANSSNPLRNKPVVESPKYLSNYNLNSSNNAVYYSLVDESLVLSDFSDIHEEGVKEMSSRPKEDAKADSSGDRCRSDNECASETKPTSNGGNDVNQTTSSPPPPVVSDGPAAPLQTNGNRCKNQIDNQTPDSLDDDPKDEQCPSAKLQQDFARASIRQSDENVLAEKRFSSTKKYNENLLADLYPELMLELSFSDKVKYFDKDDAVEFQPTSEALKNFKNYLMEKYESLKGDRATVEMKHSDIFDQLIGEDKQFLLLKYNLEEILSAESASKTEIAEHKFLYNEYEKKHGVQKTYNFIKSFSISILQSRPTKPKCDQTPDSLNDEEETPKSTNSNTCDADPVPVTSAVKEASAEVEAESKESSANKSYGFFIDLKDSNVQATQEKPATKEKSAAASKQLFSMFIDFGNSTDSDSSIGIQNKFERRKKQYFNKLEKSRELRNSVSSLNDVSENSKSEKVVQNPISNVMASQPTAEITQSEHSGVVRRNKNLHGGVSYPSANRRSWNVDKTPLEPNQNFLLRHKRSSSVSSQKDVDCTPQTRPNSQLIEREFPSIGNADSTNELTINGGESEISTYSCGSEHDKENKTPCNSNSNESSQRASEKETKTDENENISAKDEFVKLSDLDKEPKPLLNTEKWTSVRMTKSATGTENWLETKILSGSANSRSLSRIFPDISANILSKPNSDVDDTTISSISSVQSSSAVSTCESNLEVSNVECRKESTLGQDLLRMFLDEISPDVVIEVAGRRIKAHKCVLTSRCQYFAALLSGGWVESAGNVLSIHGFSYSVVHFALCYIYSGENEIPETLNIVELATLADMLCLEGLKEVISHTLKMKYCHFFHKPCNICSVGVLECLPVAVNYGLDDIHRKSLRWITKHYVRLWCSKAFASLPRELIDKCYNQHVVNMSVNNVFETLTNCDKLFSFIPQTRWAEPCFIVTKRLHDHCIKYLANHFLEFLKSDSFTSIAQNRQWGIMIVDEKTQLACAKMRADQLCHSYSYVCSQLKNITADKNEEYIELWNRVKNQVETALIKSALQASQCNAWFQMDPELRSHIQSSAGLTFVPVEIKRRVSSFKPKQPATTSSGSRAVDLQQVKSAINRQQKQNGIRSENKTSQKVNGHAKSSSTKPTSSSAKSHKSSAVSNNSKSPFRNKYANVKSRYMDRKNSKEKPTSETTPSETSEVEKNTSSSSTAANRRPSKSLVTSAHLSPAIRDTARAVSLSKIPVSVRNSSQKRTESDKDTTSGSDNGTRSSEKPKRPYHSASDPPPVRKPLAVTMKNGTTNRSYNSAPMRKSAVNTRTRNSEERSKGSGGGTKKPSRSTAESTRKKFGTDRNSNDENRLKPKRIENNPSTETSISEDIKPNVPFRRDGTFCIDEPTVLKRQSSCSERDELV